MTAMTAVFKYGPLDVVTGVDMPAGAVPLYAGIQKGGLFLWALVDPGHLTVPRTFYVFSTGTGIAFPERMAYVGSAQTASGGTVFHVFERLPA